MGQLQEQDDGAEEVSIEEQKKKKQMKVIEELITTETKYCHDISQLLATMQVLEEAQVRVMYSIFFWMYLKMTCDD